ncbi:MAG: YraN family protein [Deferribacterales bacterium]
MIPGIGQKGEKKAEKYLIQNGYKILEKNFRSRFGEIDIIAFKDGCTVFVEVKTRKNSAYGKGFEAVDARKQQKLIMTAQAFFQGREETAARFDVISIDNDSVTHIQNAFGM